MTYYYKTGIIKTSSKENEHRVPILPEYIKQIDKEILQNLVFEKGYGKEVGVLDQEIINLGAQIADRETVLQQDVVMITKPMPEDLEKMKNGATLSGWVHTVQQRKIAQLAIDKKLSLMAWENMYGYHNNKKSIYIFSRNRELAGYCSILHYLQLKGLDGFYGERQKVVVFGFGMTSRGAIYALLGRGYENIHVYTQRPTHLVADKNPNCYYHYYWEENGEMWTTEDGKKVKLINTLSDTDLIVNCILQDVHKPIMFIANSMELAKLKRGMGIVDVSCDEKMGFYFAKPTTFENPIFDVNEKISYYACDHSPSYLKHASSREVSKSLLPYLKDIVSLNTENSTIGNSYDIKNGFVMNKDVITFQNRECEYPYQMRNSHLFAK